MKIFGVVGWKNTGKTTLVARLVTHFSEAGLRVATIKHAHSGYEIDHDGTDSAAHRAAGATQVALVSDGRWVLMGEGAGGDGLPAMLARLEPCHLVLVEGFKTAPHAKIECVSGDKPPIHADNDTIIAVAGVATTLPAFDRDDIDGIASFIRTEVGL